MTEQDPSCGEEGMNHWYSSAGGQCHYCGVTEAVVKDNATRRAMREFERLLLTMWADTDEKEGRDAIANLDSDLRDKLHQAFFTGFRLGQEINK